ncbi:MAG: hypothetical protein Q9190_000422 [Brigantiaea leucoxantha]
MASNNEKLPAKFNYDRLSQPLEIRLLQLHPSQTFDADVHCTIHHALLNDRPSYEALSYTWGDPGKRSRIECNGAGTLSTTMNLDSALRHLRLPDSSRALWVDAVCINQEDLDERSRQVLLMRDIYAQAEQVVAWLGEEDPSDIDAMALGQPVKRSATKSKESALITQTETIRTYINAIFAIAALIRRPWFSRAWIIQEVAVSSKLTLQCGSKTLDWMMFSSIAEILPAIEDGNKTRLFQSDLSVQRVCFLGDVKKSIELDRLSGKGDHGDPEKNEADCSRTIKSEAERRNLEYLVARARFHGASDPRDHVYALLGLADESERYLLNADYSLPYSEMYRDYVRLLISHSGTLSVLGQLDHAENDQLCSWVPNWSRVASVSPLSDIRNSPYSASGDSKAKIIGSHNQSILVLKGVMVDSVAELAPGAETIDKVKPQALSKKLLSKSIERLRLTDRVVGQVSKFISQKYPKIGEAMKEIQEDLKPTGEDLKVEARLQHVPPGATRSSMAFLNKLLRAIAESHDDPNFDGKKAFVGIIGIFLNGYTESRPWRQNLIWGHINQIGVDNVIMTPKTEVGWVKLAHKCEPYPTGEEVDEVYWRTLIGNKRRAPGRKPARDQPPKEWRDAYDIWHQMLQRQEGLLPQVAKGKNLDLKERLFPAGYTVRGKVRQPPSIPEHLEKYLKEIENEDEPAGPASQLLIDTMSRNLNNAEDADDETLQLGDESSSSGQSVDLQIERTKEHGNSTDKKTEEGQAVQQSNDKTRPSKKPSAIPQNTKRRVEKLFWYEMLGVIKNRQFCTTKKGYMGWAPPGAKSGDRICILFGGQTPFVVRPVKQGYELLGEAYVHGLMNGEALDMPGIKIEDIALV